MNTPNPISPRPTLNLKVAPRSPASKTTPTAPSAPKSTTPPKPKPGAHWSDEYTERMQADKYKERVQADKSWTPHYPTSRRTQ
jgi:hypothetical protein